jgi:hypothetical protein
MSYGTNSSSFYRPPKETKRTPTYEELFGVPKSAERIAYDRQKEQEARISAEEARKRRIEEDKKEKEAFLINRGKELVGTYRNDYDADNLLELGAIDSIETAKIVADETYKQYWYDKANDIIGNWTDEDYKLIAEPQYEDVQIGVDPKRGAYRTEQRRVLPKGYEELQEINSYIEKGPLDFSSEETHKMLIKTPTGRGGGGKYQYWIDESDPLRQAVEAQADVMKKYLDKEGISIVTKYEDIEGFKRPDPFRGEGFYLNTGTAAHIDWDSELKRQQRYESAPDAELGTYSQVFVRPDPDYGALGDVLSVVGTLTGNPVMRNLGIAAQGGDVEDIIKGAVLQQVIPDTFLEDTFASAGITNETVNDLIGSDIGSTAWSEGLTNAGVTVLEGGDLGDALLGEFGSELAEPIVGGALDALPNVDIPEGVTNVLETIETVAQPAIDAVQTVTEAVGNVVDTAIVEPIDKLTEALVPDDVSLDDAVPPVEPEEIPVEPEETVAETQEEIPVEPEETTLVGKVADKIGFDAETVSDILDVPTDEVNKVFKETDDALFAGESGKDALLEGLGGSALEELGEGAENLLGGAVDFIETILPLDPLEDVVGAGVELADAVIGAVGDSELVNAIEEGGKALGDLGQSAIDAVVDSDIVQAVGEAGQKAIDVGSDILSEGEDIVRAGGRVVDEAIIQPALGAVEEGVEAVSNVTSEVEDVVRETGRAIDKNVIQPTKEGIDQLVRSIPNPPEIDMDLPEFTAPDIDLPEIDIDVPSIDVDIPTPSFDPRLLAGLMAMPQQQQTTQVEGLFDKELFKFDTEIKSTQEMLSPFMNLRRYG